MQKITLSRFDKNRNYSLRDSYIACVDSSANCYGIMAYMENSRDRLMQFNDEPRAWSFASWKKGENTKANLIEASAIILEYPLSAWERLASKMLETGYTHFWVSTETKTANTISLIIPLASSVGTAHYERLAAVFVQKLDEYELVDGCLAATHLIHVYATSVIDKVEGYRGCLDPLLYVKMTARQYQRDAKVFYGKMPKAAAVHLSPPVVTSADYITDDNNLFLFPLTEKERQQRATDALLDSLGIKER